MELKDNRKEIILSRLKKTAAKLWDYQESETEGFDPVINLLFGACATEFERLSTELNISQTRIFERVSQILLPEVYLQPAPSYSILHAKPTNPERFTDQADQFVFDKEIVGLANKVLQKKVCFSPTSRFRLIDAEIVLMATTKEIFQIKDLLVRESLIKSPTSKIPRKNKIWIGLKTNPLINTLKNVSFYFDWMNNPERENLSKFIQFIKLFIDGNDIPVKSGFCTDIEDRYNSETNDILSFVDINLKVEKKINNLFESNFITITADILPLKKKFPPEFSNFYSEEELKKLKEDLSWIEFELPEIFPVEFLPATFCTPNVFPVLNRKLHSSNRPYTINEDLNILPIITEDYFFSIRNIISSHHISYQEVPFKRISDFAPGTYTIRTHGVKRFDERDAYDYVQYLIELLREEHVAFKSLGSALIEKELNDLQIIINRLNLNVSKSKDIIANTHFLIMKSEMVEDIWLEYWSTTGSFANNIPAISNFFNTDFDKKTLKSLINSSGGKNPPDQIEKIFLFKNKLLTSDRVVTREDIKVICLAEAGKDIDEIIVSHGSMIVNDRNKGFQNCINVKLKLRDGMIPDEKTGLVKHLSKLLEMKSSCIYKYNVESVN